jgi:hypothetical protein
MIMRTEKKLNCYGDAEIEEAFGNAFGQKAPYHYVNSYEVVFDKDYDNDENRVVVEVSSMAGSPTREQFEKIKDLLVIEMGMVHDGQPVTMRLKETIVLNPMEFHAIYVEAPGLLAKDVGNAYDSQEEIEGQISGIEDLTPSTTAEAAEEE